MLDEEHDFLYKIIMVGEAAVGKTHLLSRYIFNSLPKCPTSTIGVEFASKSVPLQSGGIVKAQFWDTAGQERYRSITSAHYRRAVGALLVYDVTSHKTFMSLKRWIAELKEITDPGIVIMLVGNKLDLIDKNSGARKVSQQEAQVFAMQNGLMFEETSAVTSYRVKETFENLLQAVYCTRTVVQSPDDANIITNLIPKEKKCCNYS